MDELPAGSTRSTPEERRRRGCLDPIRFDVSDPVALEVVLDSASELEREQEKCAWRSLGANSKGQPSLLGSIVMEGEELELECMSARRGKRGRAMIERLAAGMVRHRSTTHENVVMKS